MSPRGCRQVTQNPSNMLFRRKRYFWLFFSTICRLEHVSLVSQELVYRYRLTHKIVILFERLPHLANIVVRSGHGELFWSVFYGHVLYAICCNSHYTSIQCAKCWMNTFHCDLTKCLGHKSNLNEIVYIWGVWFCHFLTSAFVIFYWL